MHNDLIIINAFKYTPIIFVDIERSFLIYKHLLTGRRQWTKEKPEYHLMINLNDKNEKRIKKLLHLIILSFKHT